MFVKQEKQISLSQLKHTRGIASYVEGEKGVPLTVDAHIIECLRAREDTKGMININRQRFVKGDKVLVKQGPFLHLAAIFCVQKDEERAEILMELMGREQ